MDAITRAFSSGADAAGYEARRIMGGCLSAERAGVRRLRAVTYPRARALRETRREFHWNKI